MLVCSLLLIACTGAEEILTPDGRVVYKINCDSLSLDWDDCYKKADKVCDGRGYTFIRRDHGKFDLEISTAKEAQNTAGYGNDITRYTFIQCN
jgi:hypothetical protein